MKKSRAILGGFTTLALATSLVAGWAFADTSTSSKSVKSVAPKLIEKLSISYTNLFEGSSITHPLASIRPDKETGELDPSARIRMKNYLTLGYKINNDAKIAPVIYFLYEPVQGHSFTMKDPYLKYTHNNLVKLGNFNLFGDFRMGFPGSQASRDNKMLTYLSAQPSFNYEIPNTKLTLSLWSKAQANIYAKHTTGDLNDIELYAGPNITYQILPNLSATVVYEAGAVHKQGQSITSIHDDGTDIEPSLSWDITPRINFNPYLDMKLTGERFADKTTFNASLTFKLL